MPSFFLGVDFIIIDFIAFFFQNLSPPTPLTRSLLLI